jgi:hypothetical protein
MQVFHFKGFSAILVVLLVLVAALAILVALPSAFMMVLWNALIFEAAKGPEISILQGALLWGFIALTIKAVFFPSLGLPFQLVQVGNKSEKTESTKTEDSEPSAAEIPVEPLLQEPPSQLDN